MASTTFQDANPATPIVASWLNDVNAHSYDEALVAHTAEHITYAVPVADSVQQTVQQKLQESISVKDFGAVGDGVEDDTSSISSATTANNAVHVPQGTYKTTSVTVNAGRLIGDGKNLTQTLRTNSTNGVSLNAANTSIESLTVNNQKSVNGYDGHAIAGTSSYMSAKNVQATDYGATGADGGCGICFYHTTGTIKGLRLSDSDFNANPAAITTIGWLMEGCDTSFASNLYAYHNTFCSHELKNVSTYCGLSNLIAEYTGSTLYYGQDTGTGPSYNVAVGVVGKQSDTGYTSGYANYNLTVGLLNNNTGAPGVAGTSHFARVDPGNGNALFAGLSAGSYVNTIRYNGNNNYTQLAAHDTSPTLIQVMSGAAKNATEISHPGARTTIRSSIADSSGNAIRGSNANPAWCHATGERIGSISGTFYDKLGTSGASRNSNHYWIKESDQYAIQTHLTPGNTGDIIGINYSIPGFNNYAGMLYQKNVSATDDCWYLQIGNATAYKFYNSMFRPEADNSLTLGGASNRWSTVYAGTGTINTSDVRDKQDIEELSAAELRVARSIKSLIRKFKFKDAVAAKGDAARIHVGVIAQDVKEAFEREGLDAFKYAVLCYDEWPAKDAVLDADGNVIEPEQLAGNRYGIRHDELLSFIISVI